MERKTTNIAGNTIWTPWGYADASTSYATGIKFYNTPGHGGFHLSPTLNAQVPEYMRKKGGWYEEDCDWAIVAIVFPDAFTAEERNSALATFKQWHPDAFEQHFKTVLKPGESLIKDKKAFEEQYRNSFVVTTAFGDWKEGVPKGMVGVAATKLATNETRWYLVDAAEYDKPHPFGFVIDEGLWQEIPKLG